MNQLIDMEKAFVTISFGDSEISLVLDMSTASTLDDENYDVVGKVIDISLNKNDMRVNSITNNIVANASIEIEPLEEDEEE